MDSRRELDVLVVLGSRVREGQARGALLRRLERARDVALASGARTVVLSGGKLWAARREAEVMADWWRAHGPDVELVLELGSENTRENARETALLLRSRRVRVVGLVTCDFHLARAKWLFVRQGISVVPFPATKSRSWLERLRLDLREKGAFVLDLLHGSGR